jgi:hypothetical protein
VRAVWWLLAWACVVWYSTLTVYVAVKGLFDIKRMLASLRRPDGPPSTLDRTPGQGDR